VTLRGVSGRALRASRARDPGCNYLECEVIQINPLDLAACSPRYKSRQACILRVSFSAQKHLQQVCGILQGAGISGH